jgi:hypothetical protein
MTSTIWDKFADFFLEIAKKKIQKNLMLNSDIVNGYQLIEKVVFIDNCNGHDDSKKTNNTIANFWEQKKLENTSLVFLPPNSSDYTQPLDRKYNHVYKTKYREFATAYSIEQRKLISDNKQNTFKIPPMNVLFDWFVASYEKMGYDDIKKSFENAAIPKGFPKLWRLDKKTLLE